MQILLEQFKLSLLDRGMSDNTIKSYLASVSSYLNIYGEDISQESLNCYKAYQEQHYRPQTVNLRIIAINKFLAFAGKSQLRLHLIKYQHAFFSDDIISYADYLRFKSLLQAEKEQKWYFIVWALAATGVRISELVQFKAEHIFNGSFDLRSKGNKYRRIYIPKRLQAELTLWLQKQNRLSGALFLNCDGMPISIRGISKGLERYASHYGLDKHQVHPHAFRHLFAKKFLETKNDLSMLADLLGHESLDTTKIYLRMTSQEQHDIINEIVEW